MVLSIATWLMLRLPQFLVCGIMQTSGRVVIRYRHSVFLQHSKPGSGYGSKILIQAFSIAYKWPVPIASFNNHIGALVTSDVLIAQNVTTGKAVGTSVCQMPGII